MVRLINIINQSHSLDIRFLERKFRRYLIYFGMMQQLQMYHRSLIYQYLEIGDGQRPQRTQLSLGVVGATPYNTIQLLRSRQITLR